MFRTSLSSLVTWAHNSFAVLTCVFNRKVVNAGGDLNDDSNAWHFSKQLLAPKCWLACLQTQQNRHLMITQYIYSYTLF